MALNFNQPTSSTTTQNQNAATTTVNEQETSVAPFDIVQDRKEMAEKYTNSAEVDKLVSQIEVYNMDSIVSFGSQAADEIAKCSDAVVRSMNMSQINDSGEMLNALSKIMDKFDIKEIKDNPGFFGKIFSSLRKQMDKILEKYQTMGDEVDKIFVQLKKYEAEIKESNRSLEEMFQTNLAYYHDLVKYILAGEQGVKEIEKHIQERQAEFEKTGDNAIQMDITSLNQVRKINSAFIITLPIFKQSLAQAILLKRQKIQAEALSALDAKTNEMLIRNAQNTAEQAKQTAALASGSSIKIETLEQTWKTIMQGITDTRQIQEDAKRKREEETARLEVIKKEFEEKFHQNSTANK